MCVCQQTIIIPREKCSQGKSENDLAVMCLCGLMSACMFSLYIGIIYAAVVFVCVSFCLYFYMFTYLFSCVCVSACLHVSVRVLRHPRTRRAGSVALAARGLRVVLLPSRPSRQPGGDGVRGGLLGHAVVADHCVETAPRVGVLGGVVRLQRGWDTPLVLRRERTERFRTRSR